MNKICIICPYFGPFPSYFNRTIYSMKVNNFIDWFIITDNKISINNSKNIIIKKMNFNEFKNIVSKKIGAQVKSPYKLCDYKITYGFLFSDYLKKYEFWGYCDLDIIFGDLSKVFTKENLINYDKIFDLGHISILRNIKEINEAFFHMDLIKKNYLEVLNSEYIYCVDERYPTDHKSINDIIEMKNFKIKANDAKCVDLKIDSKNFKPINWKNSNYYIEYNNGKLYINNFKDGNKKEIFYVHLQQKKKFLDSAKNNNFYFIPKGIVEYEINMINKLSFYFFDKKILWYIKFRIKRKIKNCKRDMNLGVHNG